MVQNEFDKTAEEDTEEICELAKLYMSDHIKYKKLFEYKTQSVLGNDSIRLKELYLQLKADYDILMGNKTLSKIIKENEELMSEQMLINSNENFMTGQISVPMLKGRSEQDKLAECRSLCRDEYDAKMRNIQDAYRCETVLNLLSCVLSAGVVIEENLLLQLGLIYNLHREEEQAKSELDICLGRCDLDYGD